MAIQVVRIKRHSYEKELIDLLSDASPDIRQAARQALVRLARGADFGPKLKANRAERDYAQHCWRRWWAVQDNNPDFDISQVANQH